MRRISIETGHRYDLLIGSGLLDRCGEEIARVVSPCGAAVIADDTVNALYGEAAERSLRDAGFSAVRIVFPHGEGSKNMETLSHVLESLAGAGLTRSDLIVALGGGWWEISPALQRPVTCGESVLYRFPQAFWR